MATSIEQALVDTNKIVSQVIPLVSIISVGVRATIALLKANGQNAEAKVFETELSKAEGDLAKLGESLAEFKRKYPDAAEQARAESRTGGEGNLPVDKL